MGQSGSFTSDSSNYAFMDPALFSRLQSCYNRKCLLKLSTQSWKDTIVHNALASWNAKIHWNIEAKAKTVTKSKVIIVN